MKRTITAVFLLLALLLGGCQARYAPAETPNPTASPLPTPAPTPEHPPEQFPYDYAEVLADTEDFSLAVAALGVDWEDNFVVHLRLENRSREILSFRFLYQSINGLAIDDVFTYRVAVGSVSEPSFRILRDELASWGFSEPDQWSFTLKVSSAESDAEPVFFEELSAEPFGPAAALRYEFTPGLRDFVVMENEYATVYVTGWQTENNGLSIDYVAVNKSGRPLLLVLPEGELLLDGSAHSASLKDGFGAWATLMGYIPVDGWTSADIPRSVELRLALADPSAWGDPIIEGTEVFNSLQLPG